MNFLGTVKILTAKHTLHREQSLLHCTEKIVKLWSTNRKVIGTDADPPWGDNARSEYANALEFEPRDFATRRISTP